MKKVDIKRVYFEDNSYIFVIFEWWPKYSDRIITYKEYIDRIYKVVNKIYKNREELNNALL